jgi:hypothetical protein
MGRLKSLREDFKLFKGLICANFGTMYSNLAVEFLAIDNLVVHTLDCINSLGEKEQAREQEWL